MNRSVPWGSLNPGPNKEVTQLKARPQNCLPNHGSILLCFSFQPFWASLVPQRVKNLPAMRETWVWTLGWEDPLEKGTAYPLAYSGLENSTDRGAWWAAVHGVAESRHDRVTFTFSLPNSFMKTNTVSVNSCSPSLGFAEQRQKDPHYPCRMKAWTRDKSG